MTTRPQSFLLDENMPRRVLTTLRSAGYTITRVQDENLSGQPDSAIFTFSRARQLTIVTFDTDYLKRTIFAPPHAGILVLRFFPRNSSVADITAAILNAVGQLANNDIANSVFVLEPQGLHKEV